MACLSSRWKVLPWTTPQCWKRNTQLLFHGRDLSWPAVGKNVPTNYASVNGLPARPWRSNRNKLLSQQVLLRPGHLSPLLSVVVCLAHESVLRNASEQGQSPLQAGKKMEFSPSEMKVAKAELKWWQEHRRSAQHQRAEGLRGFAPLRGRWKKLMRKRSKSGRKGKRPVIWEEKGSRRQKAKARKIGRRRKIQIKWRAKENMYPCGQWTQVIEEEAKLLLCFLCSNRRRLPDLRLRQNPWSHPPDPPGRTGLRLYCGTSWCFYKS